ncbi:aldolase/citrate lyase family protein [Devosia sp. A8/3-2]|nr:aldolase/citrate lyase family protein [Devosia sp. A8/3-2]
MPKVEDAETLRELAAQLHPLEVSLRRDELAFVPLIESPAAVLDARAIARAPRVMALSTGGEDLAFLLGAQPAPEVLKFPKLMVHYAAKAEGRLSFGLLRSTADYADTQATAEAAREARMHGFDGASCVHPSVVAVLNAAFAPSADELDWARRVVEAAASNEGAFVVDGMMVDAPVIARAQGILGG